MKIHVTSASSSRGVFGHETKHCNEAGCSGSDYFFKGLKAEEISPSQVIEVRLGRGVYRLKVSVP